MVKTYQTLKLDKETYKRFKKIKKLIEIERDIEGTMSDFINYLLDLLKPPRLPNR